MPKVICGVFRQQKLKTAADVNGREIHDKRKRQSRTNKDINRDKTKDNYAIVAPIGLTWNEAIDQRIAEDFKGKSIRKDAVRAIDVIFTADNDFFQSLKDEQSREFFMDCFQWACEVYGERNIIAATVHLDEKTPHMHVLVVPITPEGNYNANQLMGGGRRAFQQRQDDFYNSVSKKWGLERGERADVDELDKLREKAVASGDWDKYNAAKPRRHKNVQTFKRDTGYTAEKQNDGEDVQTVKPDYQTAQSIGDELLKGILYRDNTARKNTDFDIEKVLTEYIITTTPESVAERISDEDDICKRVVEKLLNEEQPLENYLPPDVEPTPAPITEEIISAEEDETEEPPIQITIDKNILIKAMEEQEKSEIMRGYRGNKSSFLEIDSPEKTFASRYYGLGD